MLLSRRARALVKTIDVCIESLSIDPPDPASSDLDGRQLTRPNKRVDLRHADIEIGRYIGEGEKPGLGDGPVSTLAAGLLVAHRHNLPSQGDRCLCFPPFTLVGFWLTQVEYEGGALHGRL